MNWNQPVPSGLPLPPVQEQNLYGLVEWVFFRQDVLPVTQPSVSKHWREHKELTPTSGLSYPSPGSCLRLGHSSNGATI